MVLNESSTPRYQFFFSANRTEITVCYDEKFFNASTWKPEPTTFSLPVLYIQIFIMMASTGFVLLLLKPFYQQRLTAGIIAGILMGPSFLGNYPAVVNWAFPYTSVPVLTMFKNIGIIFYMFLVGLEMNLTPIVGIRDDRTSYVAAIGWIIPHTMGIASFFILFPGVKSFSDFKHKYASAFPWAVALTSTNMPNLIKTLSDLKLLRTEIGRMALSSAFVSDMGTWLALLMIVVLSHEQASHVAVSALVFLVVSIFVVRPSLSWLISRTSASGLEREQHIHFVVFGVILYSLATDTLGLTSVVGAFIFGFIFPTGRLTTRVIEQLGAVTNWISIPLYCLDNGLKTHLDWMLSKSFTNSQVITFIVFCWMAKIISTLLVSYYYKMETREAITLAVLMNVKGLLPLIIINFAKDQLYAVSIETSTVMVLTILTMMVSVPIIVKLIYKPQKRAMCHSLRTVESIGSDWPLRILVGIHSMTNVGGLINLVNVSNSTQRSPISLTVVHLVELTEQNSAAALLIVHNRYGPNYKKSSGNNTKVESDQIIEAIEEYGGLDKSYVSMEFLTALSPYKTMHEDICSIAEDKYATILILPFDLQGDSAEDGTKNANYSSIRILNQNMLALAPCTIGLLVNQDLGMFSSSDPKPLPRPFLMFFIGGPDDREALTYAQRMVWHHEVHLTVVRFIEGKDLADSDLTINGQDDKQGILNILMEYERQREADEEFMSEFIYRTTDNRCIRYIEEVSNNGEETMTVIRDTMAQESYELCIVGRGDKRMSPLISGLSDLIEYPELGPIADAVVTSHFSGNSSVLVIQHYAEKSQSKR